MSSDSERLAWVASIIQKNQKSRTYGEVIIKMEAGKIVHVDEKKSHKPPKKRVLDNGVNIS